MSHSDYHSHTDLHSDRDAVGRDNCDHSVGFKTINENLPNNTSDIVPSKIAGEIPGELPGELPVWRFIETPWLLRVDVNDPLVQAEIKRQMAIIANHPSTKDEMEFLESISEFEI